MRWVQILAPTEPQYQSLRPLLAESLSFARENWKRRELARRDR
jgi:hypothetical protein